MIRRIKRVITGIKNNQKKIISQNNELIWAHIYHDSIRGKKYLQDLSLNVGRWAGNYSLFYVLNRILSEYKPNRILEFGLGETSKFISTYLINELENSKHIIIEEDINWKIQFERKFTLSKNTKIEICPIEKRNINGYEVNFYQGLELITESSYDLYLIDGPFGSERYSRYDIVNVIKNTNLLDEFIIIIDDYDRIGEKDTANDLIEYFRKINKKIYSNVYAGNKSVFVISTEMYKHAVTF
jgi:16S rRNA G966 N2-methylase RsmD